MIPSYLFSTGLGGSPVITSNVEIVSDPTIIGHSGQPDPDIKFIIIQASLRQEIYNTDDRLPIIGTRAVSLGQTDFPLEGFQYDRRRWTDDEISATRNPGYIGNIEYGIVEGTKAKHWLSGIGDGDDCEFLELVPRTECEWLPRLNHGTYFSQYKEYYFWSEEAITHRLIEGWVFKDVTDFAIALDYPTKSTVPITATIYSRNDLTWGAEVYKQSVQVQEFTGQWNGSSQIDTFTQQPLLETTYMVPAVDYSTTDNFARDELLYNANLWQSNELSVSQNLSTTALNGVASITIEAGENGVPAPVTIVLDSATGNHTPSGLRDYINNNVLGIRAYLKRADHTHPYTSNYLVIASNPNTAIRIIVTSPSATPVLTFTEGQEITFNSNIAFKVGDIRHWLIMNHDASIMTTTTTDPVALANAEYKLERLGVSSGNANNVYLTKFFPIDPEEPIRKINVYTWKAGGTLRLWPIATGNALQNHSPGDYVCEIDYDFGFVRFSISAPDAKTRLTANIAHPPVAGENIQVQSTEGFPNQGRLRIGSTGEIIQYETKDEFTFYNLTRPSPQAGAIALDDVTFEQCGAIPGANEIVSAAYFTTPRIEYEPKDFKDHVTADTTNVHPISKSNSNGIVYIGRSPDVLGSLVLSTNLPPLGAGMYGPLGVGSAYAMLTATAYDNSNNALPDVSIKIDQVTSPFLGYLSGCPCPYESISNMDGEIITNYSSGNDLDMVGENVVNYNSPGGNEVHLTVDSYLPGLNLAADPPMLFAITKDDPIAGTEGIHVKTTTNAWLPNGPPGSGSNVDIGNIIFDVEPPYNASMLPLHKRFPRELFNHYDGEHGTAVLVDDGGAEFPLTIVGFIQDKMYFAEDPSPFSGTIRYIRVLPYTWTSWDSTNLNGRKRVIYQYNGTNLNPVTLTAGCYYPIEPISYNADNTTQQTTFIFDTTAAGFPLPNYNSTNTEKNLGGYWLSTNAIVTFQASAIDPFTGSTMLSNKLSVQISLPDYLKGVSLLGTSKVPYGWQLTTPSGLPSTGVGPNASTFVTINPVIYGPGSTLYPAVSNPFGVINFALPLN